MASNILPQISPDNPVSVCGWYTAESGEYYIGYTTADSDEPQFIAVEHAINDEEFVNMMTPHDALRTGIHYERWRCRGIYAELAELQQERKP